MKQLTVRASLALLYIAYAIALWSAFAGLQASGFFPGGFIGLLVFLIVVSSVYLYLWNKLMRSATITAVRARWLAFVSGAAVGITAGIYVVSVYGYVASQVFQKPWQG